MGRAATELDQFIERFVAALMTKIRVERILLFGSRARGDADSNSDIDLIIVSPDFGQDVLADYALLQRHLPQDLEVEVDVIPRTPAQIAAAEPDSFLSTVLKDAVTVYA